MKKYLNTTAILAIATALAYVYAYLYNAGYNEFFHLPQQLMSFSMPAIIGSLIALASTIALLWGNIVGIQVKDNEHPVGIMITTLGLMALILVLLTLSFGAPWSSPAVLVLVVFLVIYIYLFFIHPLFSHRRTKGYVEKVRLSTEARIERAETIGDFIYGAPAYRQSILLVVLLGTLFCAFYIGYHDASRIDTFHALANDKRWVVAKYTDNSAVLVEQVNGKLSGSFTLLNISGESIDDSRTFKRESIGRLHD